MVSLQGINPLVAVGVVLAVIAFTADVGMVIYRQRRKGREGCQPGHKNPTITLFKALGWRIIAITLFIYVYIRNPQADGWKPLTILVLAVGYVLKNFIALLSSNSASRPSATATTKMN
jgi:small-conductance mechanosensitive channel